MPRSKRTLFIALLLVAGLPGCGGGGDDNSAEPATVTQTVEQTTTEEAPPAKSTDAGSGGADSGGSGRGGNIAVPDVVGEDHQLAQDTLQAKGLYSLDEEDATGQGRLLLFDRNWTVVRQDPSAGTRVSPDETITLYSKKDDE